MTFSSITSSLTQSAKSMNSLATKIGTHLQNQFGPTIDGIKDSLDVLKAGQDMVSTVVHDVTGQDVNIRSIQKGSADFDEKWDAFVKEINSKFNTASPNGQADIMETFVKSHFGDDVYNLGSAIKNELPNVLDGIADYQETINSISSDSKTVEEAATKINNGVEKMVKATEKIASSINNAVEICTGKGIPILDELSKIGSSADVVNLNKALNIGMTGAKAATAANQLKQSIKNKDLRGITDAMAKGATSVNSLMSQLQQIVPGFPNAQIPVKITDSIKRLQNAQSVYDAAGSMVTALVADASGRHDLSSFATLASNFNQNWDTFSSKIDALFNIVPANGQQAVLETLAKNMFGENVFYAAGAIKRQTPGFLSGLAGVQDAIKQLGGSYRNPIEAVTKIRNCTEKIVQSVEKIGQSLNNMVKYYQGKGDITKGTGYPLLEMMGNLGDTKGIKALDYILRTAGGTAAIVGKAGAVAQAIKNKDIPGAIAAVKKTIDDFKNLTKKGNYKAQGNDKGALPNNNNSKSSSPPNEQQEKQKSQLSSGQTDSYVCSGATMRCTMGTSQAKLTVLPTRTVFLTGQPMANISDHLSMINLSPFGNCRSMGFPATAAATAANYGTLTPQPCMHNTPFPWLGGKNDYIIKGDPALLKSSTCPCMWGGTISITDDGQHGEGTQWVRKLPREAYPHKEMQLVKPPLSLQPPAKTNTLSEQQTDTLAPEKNHTSKVTDSIRKTQQRNSSKELNSQLQSSIDSQRKNNQKKYKLVLKDAYWEKDKMKIRFIPHQMEKPLIVVFSLVEDPDGVPRDEVSFWLKFDVPGTLFPKNKVIKVKMGDKQLHGLGYCDVDGNVVFSYTIENFSSDLTKVECLEYE